jgi:DNA repair exonuclease SbcCD ATPase subunit
MSIGQEEGAGAARKPEKTPTENAETDKLEKIRDILFGQQVRELEERLRVVEERLSGNLSALEQASAGRMDGIEKQIGELQGNLGSERDERQSGERSLTERLEELSRSLERAVGELASGKTDRAALAQMLAQMATQLGEEGGGG